MYIYIYKWINQCDLANVFSAEYIFCKMERSQAVETSIKSLKLIYIYIYSQLLTHSKQLNKKISNTNKLASFEQTNSMYACKYIYIYIYISYMFDV